MLTIRMNEQEHGALKRYAVLQGRSVNVVVTELIRAELARQAPGGSGRSREEFAAELLARFGIDPGSAEHQAAAGRARAEVRRKPGGRNAQGAA